MSRLAMLLALTALLAGCDSATAPADDLTVTGNPCAARPVTACLPTPGPGRHDRPPR
jgi:PBP1b-binding outer membrane lipoprotein LpoB